LTTAILFGEFSCSDGRGIVRRILVVVVAVTLMLFGLTAPASSAPSPEAALHAAFNAGFSGGNGSFYGELIHGGNGAAHNAPNSIFDPGGSTVDVGARRIIPGFGDFFVQEYCSSNVFGVWWYLVGPDKSGLDADVEISIDGVPLEVGSTPAKRYVDPQGVFETDKGWVRAFGVPVYGGTLTLGDHLVESAVDFPDDDPFFDFGRVTILDC
jgi:hypothetical protein